MLGKIFIGSVYNLASAKLNTRGPRRAKVEIVKLSLLRLQITLTLVAFGLTVIVPAHSSTTATSIEYAACLSQGTNTPSMIYTCKNLRPKDALAKPVEYEHCLNMGTNISIQARDCKKFRPSANIAKPIEYRFCLKWWGTRDPGCKKYKP